MARTILDLVKSALYRSNAQQIPTALVASTNSSDLQLLHLLYGVGEELRAMGCWPQLKRSYKLRLFPGQDGYSFPANFYSLLPYTSYDLANSRAVVGPTTDADWNLQVRGIGAQGPEKMFRLFGTGGRYFKVNPTPGDGDAISYINIEYICRDIFLPPPWTASEGSLTQNLYRHAFGIIYKKTDSGSDTAGTNRPSMTPTGEGQDGGVRWQALSTSAFSTTTLYTAGSYFTTGGNLYRVTVGGTSGGSAPTSTTEDTDITNGTLTIRYHAAASWTGQTDFDFGDHLLISSQYYRCEQGGKTGSVQPTWTTALELDNTIDWTPQDIAYETPQLDTDFMNFDEELVIAGLRAKLFQARGLGAEDLVYSYERMKKQALGRWNAGMVLDLAAGCDDSSINLAPISNWTAV